MMRKVRAALLAAFMLAGFSAAAAEMPPDVLVKNTAQDVLAIVKQDKDIQSGNSKRCCIWWTPRCCPTSILPAWRMLAVGRYWPKATPAQQQALINEFRTLLVRTYSNSLDVLQKPDHRLQAAQMQPGDTDVTVKTVVNQPGGQPIPIDYSLEKSADGWKVYDVAVDNISLVTNYRGSLLQRNSQVRHRRPD